MKSLTLALRLLTPAERKTAMLIMPLIILSGFADMVGVAMIFPFLKVLGEPGLVQSNSYLSYVYTWGGFGSADEFIFVLGIGFFVMLLATAGLKILTVYVANRWLEGRIHSLSKRLLAAYLKQPYPFMLQRNSSELVANMLSETARIVSQVFRAFSEFVVAAVTLFFLVALLLAINPSVTLLAMGTFSALYTVLLLSVRRISSRLGQTILSTNRKRHRLAMEALIGGKQVRLLNRERNLIERYSVPSSGYANANALSNTVRMAPRHIIESVAIGGTVLLTLLLSARSGGTGSAAMADMLPTLGVFVLAAEQRLRTLHPGGFHKRGRPAALARRGCPPALPGEHRVQGCVLPLSRRGGRQPEKRDLHDCSGHVRGHCRPDGGRQDNPDGSDPGAAGAGPRRDPDRRPQAVAQ